MSDQKPFQANQAYNQGFGALQQAAYSQQAMAAQESPRPDMTFGQAIAALKRGSRVARRGWNGKGMFLELQRPCEHSKMRQPYIYIVPVGGEPVPWVASQPDLLEEDWTVLT